ncbi:MAG TPA: hypothetical protein VF665_11725 [Longimicrobium sp.]|jgi:hypothetical protein|uniref:hypothetical protein n=1 Tax=Longimicrobium sp. TaxID=2029185 RepID=UPI002EDA597D
MIRVPPRLAAACIALPLAAGCSDVTTATVCDNTTVPSVLVSVMNDARQPVSASGTWTAGTLSDSLRHLPGDSARLAAYGPAGVYTVRVQGQGTAPWVATNVYVTAGQCGPATAYLEATIR